MIYLSPIKIIFAVFALFAWSRAILRFREKNINFKELIFWTLVWASLVVLVFIPGKTDFIARKLGVAKGTDFMFFLSITILYYIVYRIYVKLNEIDKEITILVRKISLEKTRKK